MVGSIIIDWAMGVITKGELAKATTTWKQVYFRAVISGLLQLPCTSSNGTGGGKGGDPFLHGCWHCGGKGVLLGQCLGPSLHYMEGYSPLIQYCQYAWQYQCQGTLYVGSHACRAKTRPPVGYISGADCNLWRITSRILSGTHLFAKLKCSFLQNPS